MTSTNQVLRICLTQNRKQMGLKDFLFIIFSLFLKKIIFVQYLDVLHGRLLGSHVVFTLNWKENGPVYVCRKSFFFWFSTPISEEFNKLRLNNKPGCDYGITATAKRRLGFSLQVFGWTIQSGQNGGGGGDCLE